MSNNGMKKKQKHVHVVRGERGWEGKTTWDRGILVLWYGTGKPYIPFGTEESAQENAWLSNKKIEFDEGIKDG